MAILDYSSGLNQALGNTAGSRALGMMKGLGGLETQRFNQQQAEAKATQQQEQIARSQQAILKGAELLKSGTPDEIAAFGMQNPDVMKDFIQAANFKDQTALKSRVKYAQDVLSGNANPRTALISRIQEVEASGGDAQGLWQTLKLDDDGIKKAAEKDLAVISPDMYKSYKDAISAGQPEAMTEYQSAMIKGKEKDRGLRQQEIDNSVAANDLKKEELKLNIEAKKQNIAKRKIDAANKAGDVKKAKDLAVAEAENALFNIDAMLGEDKEKGEEALDLIYGAQEGLYPDFLRSQEGANLIARKKQIASSMALAAAGKLKGQGSVSEGERQLLREAAAFLADETISPELAREELLRIKPIFEKIRVGDAGSLSDEELFK